MLKDNRNAFDVVGSYRGREAYVGGRGLVGMSWVERERQRHREARGRGRGREREREEEATSVHRGLPARGEASAVDL